MGNPMTELRSVTRHRPLRDHAVLLATLHKWTRPALYLPRGMEGWVDLGSLIAAWPGIEATTARSQIRKSDALTVMPPSW